MRIKCVRVSGIGGLADTTVDLPQDPVTAFAGANGTGKSKLLAALLSPWSSVVPTPRGATRAEVEVTIELTQSEREAIARLSAAAGWGAVDLPDSVTITCARDPMLGGTQRTSSPQLTVLQQMFVNPEFLGSQRTLDLVYLPAERRLLDPNQRGIDLDQLSELIAVQKTAETRSAPLNYGRLDDQEFEQFAKALCVADTLPDEANGDAVMQDRRVAWAAFSTRVNALIAPKLLLPLTRQHPDQLRIRTPDGETHPVRELSSGERQALIIISRVLRAGVGQRVVLIDEPDAYLHPNLSRRLMQALEEGIGEDGQMIVATHSPAILDNLAPSQIIRLEHGREPRFVSDETERVELYRDAGFRASALTQADLLVITEGESDVALLTLAFPDLARAAIRSAGGRPRVIREVEQLLPYELPVLGVVDKDVLAELVPSTLEEYVTVWSAADIEGVFLSDDAVLEQMVALGLIKREFRSGQSLRELLNGMTEALKSNAIAEIAQRRLRKAAEQEWPSPRGDEPLDRLRRAADGMTAISSSDVEQAIADAESLWNGDPARWTLVRGKWIADAFASRASEMRSGAALLEAVARSQPKVHGFDTFAQRVAHVLGKPGSARA